MKSSCALLFALGRVLVVSRAKAEVREWVQKLAKWPFKRIIPAHFSAPLSAGPQDLLQAYSFLLEDDKATATPAKKPAPAAPWPFASLLGGAAPAKRSTVVFPERDLSILNALDKFVSATGIAN